MDTKVCATTDETSRWEDIDFQKAREYVKKLQRRIAAADAAGRYDVALYCGAFHNGIGVAANGELQSAVFQFLHRKGVLPQLQKHFQNVQQGHIDFFPAMNGGNGNPFFH